MFIRTLSPFEPGNWKEIHEHLTLKEKRDVRWINISYGILWLLTYVLPVWVILIHGINFVAVAVLIVGIIGVTVLSGKHKKYLASTEWAKAQGYTVDKIHWFSFRRDRSN